MGELPDLFEGLTEDAVEFLPHAVEAPLVVLAVLHPLEPTGRHAARVDEDVGGHDHALRVEDRVGLGRDRGVGGLDDERGLHGGGVFLREHAAEGGGDQHVAVDGEELGIREGVAAGETGEPAAVGPGVAEQFKHVEAALAVEAAAGVGDGDDPAFGVGEEFGGVGADVAEALDGDPRARDFPAEAASRELGIAFELMDCQQISQVRSVSQELLAKYGTPEILVLAHGVMSEKMAKTLKTNDQEWARVLDINLNSVFTLVNSIAAPMAEARNGRVIIFIVKFYNKYVVALIFSKKAIIIILIE